VSGDIGAPSSNGASVEWKIVIYSVIISITGSALFVWLLDPFTRWMLQAATDRAGAWRVILRDQAFSSAARGAPITAIWMTYATIEYVFLCLSFIGLLFFIVFIVLSLRPRDQLSVPIGELWTAFERSTLVNFARSIRVLRVLAVLMILALLATSYKSVKSLFFAVAELRLNASFNQRLNAIMPYIDAAEEKRLKSAWALMRNRADYLRINAQIAKHAENVQIALPKPDFE
jgi:hypothetical protein